MPTRGNVAEFSERSLSEILDSFEPRMRRAFLQMLARIRSQLGPDALETLIREHRFEDASQIYEDASRLFAREASHLFVESGQAHADFISNALDVVIGFDQFSESAVRYIRESELTNIRGFVQEQREVVRQVITEGIARGTNPREMARQFRDSVGLTPKQLEAVSNYRRALESGTTEALSRELRDRRFDSSVQRAAQPGGEPLSKEQIDRMVSRYTERFVKFRSETIARDQSLRAMHAGQEESFNQVLGVGGFSSDQITYVWNNSGDDGRTREAHLHMRVDTVGPGENFIDGDGNELAYPGDPTAPPETTIQCRCVRSVRVSLRRGSEAEDRARAGVTVSIDAG